MDMISPGLVYTVFLAVLVIASVIDVKYYLLPDIITVGGGLVAIPLAVGILGLTWSDSIGGACMGTGSFWLIQRLYRYVRAGAEGLGTGDVKFMMLIGAVCGWQALPQIVFVACASALCVAGVIYFKLCYQKKPRVEQLCIPFGPFLSLGAMAHVLSLAF